MTKPAISGVIALSIFIYAPLLFVTVGIEGHFVPISCKILKQKEIIPTTLSRREFANKCVNGGCRTTHWLLYSSLEVLPSLYIRYTIACGQLVSPTFQIFRLSPNIYNWRASLTLFRWRLTQSEWKCSVHKCKSVTTRLYSRRSRCAIGQQRKTTRW